MEASTIHSLSQCVKIGMESRLTARGKIDSKDSEAISDLAACVPAAPHRCQPLRGIGPLFHLYFRSPFVGHIVPCEAQIGTNQAALRYRGHVPKSLVAIPQTSHHTTFTARCCSSGSVRHVLTLPSQSSCIPLP